jgi:Raf kinase inhibitor-like YbhB/YbcL family protein
MKITSPAFKDGEHIPVKYSCQGDNVSPPLTIEGIPQNAKSLALAIEDPDAAAGPFVHWVVFDIAVTGPGVEIDAGSTPGKQGLNSQMDAGYTGPCPPSGTHRYFFRAWALDTMLHLKEGITRAELERAMRGHVVAQAEFMAPYTKAQKVPAGR